MHFIGQLLCDNALDAHDPHLLWRCVKLIAMLLNNKWSRVSLYHCIENVSLLCLKHIIDTDLYDQSESRLNASVARTNS